MTRWPTLRPLTCTLVGENRCEEVFRREPERRVIAWYWLGSDTGRPRSSPRKTGDDGGDHELGPKLEATFDRPRHAVEGGEIGCGRQPHQPGPAGVERPNVREVNLDILEAHPRGSRAELRFVEGFLDAEHHGRRNRLRARLEPGKLFAFDRSEHPVVEAAGHPAGLFGIDTNATCPQHLPPGDGGSSEDVTRVGDRTVGAIGPSRPTIRVGEERTFGEAEVPQSGASTPSAGHELALATGSTAFDLRQFVGVHVGRRHRIEAARQLVDHDHPRPRQIIEQAGQAGRKCR